MPTPAAGASPRDRRRVRCAGDRGAGDPIAKRPASGGARCRRRRTCRAGAWFVGARERRRRYCLRRQAVSQGTVGTSAAWRRPRTDSNPERIPARGHWVYRRVSSRPRDGRRVPARWLHIPARCPTDDSWGGSAGSLRGVGRATDPGERSARDRPHAAHPPANAGDVSWAYARLEWADGTRREAWLRTGEGYTFTARVAASVATRLVEGSGRPGAFTPGALFGAELARLAGAEMLSSNEVGA